MIKPDLVADLRLIAPGKKKLRFCALCGEEQGNNWVYHHEKRHKIYRKPLMKPLEEG